MRIKIIRPLLLLLGFKIVLFCFSSVSSSLMAQQNEDSVSVVKELTPDEVDQQVTNEEEHTPGKFIRKDERYRE